MPSGRMAQAGNDSIERLFLQSEAPTQGGFPLFKDVLCHGSYSRHKLVLRAVRTTLIVEGKIKKRKMSS